MIPSTVIWGVKYTTRDKESWCAEDNICTIQNFNTEESHIYCIDGQENYTIHLTAEKWKETDGEQ